MGLSKGAEVIWSKSRFGSHQDRKRNDRKPVSDPPEYALRNKISERVGCVLQRVGELSKDSPVIVDSPDELRSQR